MSWRIFWLTIMNRAAPDAPPELALTTGEIKILDHVVAGKPHQVNTRTISFYLTKIARLGGYLARTHDPPPGNKVMWRGWSRLADIKLGAGITVTYG